MSALVGLDIALAVAGLAILAGFTLRLWRQVKVFGRSVSTAGARLGDAQQALAAIQERTAARSGAKYTQTGSARSGSEQRRS